VLGKGAPQAAATRALSPECADVQHCENEAIPQKELQVPHCARYAAPKLRRLDVLL